MDPVTLIAGPVSVLDRDDEGRYFIGGKGA